MSQLELRDVSVGYNAIPVIHSLCLTIEEGKIFTLLGPSGSGKSTLLLCIAGLLSPATGEILLAGQPITHISPNRRDIGFVFQSYALFPHMTVVKNISYALKVRGLSRKEVDTRVSEMVELVRLQGFEYRYPRELSGGQQQRVALARALVFRPRLLLLDEPLGALDADLREEMQFEIKRLHRISSSTILYVTHNQEEAMTLSDKIGIIRNGTIDQTGAPLDLYQNPKNRFVAGFIGKASFLDVEVTEMDGGHCSVSLNGVTVKRIPAPSWLTRIGTRAKLMVRPENCHISPLNDDNSTDRLLGIVEDIIYTGNSLMVRCRLSDGSHLTVRETADSVFSSSRKVLLQIDGTKTRIFELGSDTNE